MSHPQAHRAAQRGFVLISLITLLVMGALAFLVSNLSPEFMQAYRQRQADAALTQAREALIGYAVQYRDRQLATGGTNDAMYGFLPMPDVGTSRLNLGGQPASCNTEGCAMAFINGTFPAQTDTVIGRFPWRTVGTGPLRDSHGECLWYIVSANFKDLGINPSLIMNWDTLSQLDVVVANGTAAMQNTLASKHDRPIAIIFSPGPPLAGQNRSASATDTVTECGGNYDAKNYLDPATITALGGVTHYFAGSTNNASGDTSATAKSLSTQGAILRKSDGTLWAGSCPPGATCDIAANDKGLTLTSYFLFASLRKSSLFRLDINSMLDRMVGCLRDQVAAGTGFTPDALTGFTPPPDKSVGRIPSSTCYDDTQNPLGYFAHYRDQVFVAKPSTGTWVNAVTVDGVVQASCSAALLFASQRGTKNPAPTDAGESSTQLRTTDTVSTTNSVTNKNWPANYLEGSNLTGFTSTGVPAFSGPSLLAQVSASQTANQDIVRCIPAGASLTTVESPNLTPAQQLVAYDPATSTLILGKLDVTNSTAGAGDLFGCAWIADEKTLGSGFRSYFQFSFATLGTSVGNTGFVFSLVDTESNTSLPCGAAGSHLGYSGDNTLTPKVKFPKLGIEFDQSRNSGFPGISGETSTAVGRNDPCGTAGCGGTIGYNSHAAIVYWGHETANATDAVTLPDGDDNVHGFPSAASLVTTRRPPTNPSASPGIKFINLRTGGDLFHVRVEVTPTRTTDLAAAENSKTSMQTKVWILRDSVTDANQIIAMKDTTRPMSTLYPGFTETLSDTGAVFDVAESSCSSGTCPSNQTCGTDNVCYRQGLRKARLGFTGSQRTQDQEVTISKIFTTWLP